MACLGLAFKPDIDDLRESPALEVVQKLVEEKIDCLIVEPNVEQHSDFQLYLTGEAVEKADIIVVLVAHSSFKKLKFAPEKVVLDFVGLNQ